MNTHLIPVTILTGFLGAGKTSLLNRLLKDPNFADAMVLINEFGEISIDHLLVERSDDTIIELSNGCLCCTVRSDLVDRLSDLITRIRAGSLKKISHLLIETTGLADPIPILQLFITHPLLLSAFHFEGLISVVDGVNGFQTLETYKEARRQIAVADRIFISKSDLVTNKENLHQLLRHIHTLNHSAEIIVSGHDKEDNSALLPRLWHANGQKEYDFEQEHKHEHTHHRHDKNRHSETIHSFYLSHDKPLPLRVIEAFLGQLTERYGERILRLKGIVATVEKLHQPLIVQGAQGLFHPPQWLPCWGEKSHETRLVVIADDVLTGEVQELFGIFTEQMGIDRVDRRTLESNPLAIIGMKL